MIRVGFLLNYDHQSWLGGFNVIINLFRSINLIKKKRLIPILIVPIYFKKYYKKYNIPKDQIIFTNLFTEQKLSSKLINKIRIFLFGKSQIYDDFLKKKKISIISHGLFFGLGAKSEIKSVSWIPDFQHLHFPQYFTAKNRLFKYLNTLISIKTSNSTILSSYDAKKDLEMVLSKKFYKGIVHPYVFDLPKKKDLIKYSKLKKKYDIPKKYFYIPNQFWKHKNHEIIIETLKFLQKKRERINIILTGYPYDHRHKNHFNEIITKVKTYNLKKNFIYLGVLPYIDAMSLMYNSMGVINPSKFEGCSSSVEQSKSMGKKIILSNINIHKEQNPVYSYYFKPDNYKQLAKILVNISKNYNRKSDLSSIDKAYKSLNHRLKNYALKYQNKVLKI